MLSRLGRRLRHCFHRTSRRGIITGHNSPLISATALKQQINDGRTQILDASWHLPNSGQDAKENFINERLPRARFFDIDKIVDPESTLPHTLPSPREFERHVGDLGISNDQDIVVYDTVGLFSAARAWFMFWAAGHRRVFVLDGGLPAWRDIGGDHCTGTPVPFEKATFVCPEELKYIANIKQAAATSDSETQLIDARGAERFAGHAPEPREGVESGHIPGSTNIPFTELLEADHRMKDIAELRRVFENAGIDMDKPVITSCGSGVTASVLTLGLTLAGHRDHKLFDGSWAEYGSSDLPKSQL